jgi:hypothetical protein
MDSFLADYHGKRCGSGTKSCDIFNDYNDLLDGVSECDDPKINWQLNNDATAEEFESWERLLQGFYRCTTYDHNMDDSTHSALAVRRVDLKLHNWWYKAMWEKSITSAT